MDELGRVGLVVGLIYGNYLLFRSKLWTIFWALCYNVLQREIRKSRLRVLHPLLLLGSLFPVVLIVGLPSLVVVVGGQELLAYTEQVLVLVEGAAWTRPWLHQGIRTGVSWVLACLGVGAEEQLSEELIWYRLYVKLEECMDEVLMGSKVAFGWLSECLFFWGVLGCFNALPENPLYYAVRPLPQHREIVGVLETIVHAYSVGCLGHFIYAVGLGMCTGSPLILVGGVAAAFLSLFPVAPLCLYVLPSAVYLGLAKHWISLGVLLVGGLVQARVVGKLVGRKPLNSSGRTISAALGMQAFGLAGAILGPFLLGSLLVIWRGSSSRSSKRLNLVRPSVSVSTTSSATKTSTHQPTKPNTQTVAEIMRKKK
ncbi:hypothetical protein NEHOM01_0629 [Nematocida homosporus]|uniref:uncharacterized protein n=1 Tax=Nematocida homosporus TaxID=1912981 RepID=UPI002220D8EF|nr:uncharacterized protein NEHOM01_0629 [Nematocida homosporus]KAI5185124.1 hypothetical protein NEHOM01_0629 [Nematocida homosporus]